MRRQALYRGIEALNIQRLASARLHFLGSLPSTDSGKILGGPLCDLQTNSFYDFHEQLFPYQDTSEWRPRTPQQRRLDDSEDESAAANDQEERQRLLDEYRTMVQGGMLT